MARGTAAIRRTPHALVPVLLVVVLGATVVRLGMVRAVDGERGAPPPAPPPVEELADPVAGYPDDDLHRYVVTPPELTPAPSMAESDVDPVDPTVLPPASTTAITSEPVRWPLDPEKVLRMPPGARLVVRHGMPGYLDENGTFVSLAATSTVPTTAVEPAPAPAVDPIEEELSAIDGVEDVTPIGDGSYGVETSIPGVLDAIGWEVTDDLPLALADDPYRPYQWALHNGGDNLDPLGGAPAQVDDGDIDGLEAMAGPRGTPVVVALIDSGVDFDHPDLAGQAWENSDEDCDDGVDDDGNGYVDDCRGWDFHDEDNEPFDVLHSGHGTHVAGIIAAVADNGVGITGLAPGARIMDLSVTPEGPVASSTVARAIRYAVDNGADVVNLSLASAPGAPVEAVTSVADAVAYAGQHGVLVVAAAGNHGADLDDAPVYPASIDASNLVTVGASTAGERRASFSNHGTAVDLFAPGDLVVSTVPDGYAFMSGTSQAAPLVSAVAATVLSRTASLSPEAVIDQIVGTGDEGTAYLGASRSGVRLNAARAVGLQPDWATVSISGLADADTEGVRATIAVANVDQHLEEPFTWHAALLAVPEIGAYGITDHPVLVDGTERFTDGRGSVSLTRSQTTEVTLETDLPPGRYALAVEAVLRADPSIRLGPAHVAAFDVADAGSPADTVTTLPAPVPATAAPDPTGPDPDPATSPPQGSEEAAAEEVAVPTSPVDVVAGDWSVADISPRSGPTSDGSSVSLRGSFPEPVAVWFGSQVGTVQYQSASWIVVTTPYRSEPGVSEISLRIRAEGVILTVPEAYAFVDGTDSDGSQPATTGTAPTTTVTPAPNPTTTPGGGGGDEVVGPGPAVAGPRTGSRQLRAQLLAGPVDLGNGLLGTPLGRLEGLGSVPRCTSAPCRLRLL